LQTDFFIKSNIIIEKNVAIERSITNKKENLFELLFYSIDIVNLTLLNIIIEQITINREEAAIVTKQIIKNNNLISILAIIFYFMRTNNINKQNIVNIKNIYNSSIDFLS